MIRTVRAFFEIYVQELDNPDDAELSIKVACAALLIEVAKADFSLKAVELKRIRLILSKTLELSPDQLDELMELAQIKSEGSTSLHEFTSLVHNQYSLEQKIELFTQLWRVAYADGKLDKFEEYLLRKIADLIYLPHQHYIRTKQRVLSE